MTSTLKFPIALTISVTNNVFELDTLPNPHTHILPSTRYLAKRRNAALAKHNRRRQISTGPLPKVQEDLLTFGGRIYITNATIAGRTYSFVIDSGSSDTWIVSSFFQCDDPDWPYPLDAAYCGFGSTYDASASSSYRPVDFPFSVNYTGGEFLRGRMGTENFGIGGLSKGGSAAANVRQMIGVVDEGYWFGDGVSSGLMGLGFPALAVGINSKELNYTSVLFTFLALRRPTYEFPRAGGQLAIGGIPDVKHDGRWVEVPLQPVVRGIYAWYSIIVDGFDIIPPPESSSVRSTSTPAPVPRQTRPYATSRQTMIIDSGSSLIYFPSAVAEYIASLFVPPATYNWVSNTYIVRCTAQAPRVGVKIGGRSFFLSEDDLMNRGPNAVGGENVGAGPGECALAIQRAEGGTPVLGDTWLNNVLVVFELANGTDIGVGGSDKNGNGGGTVRIVGREVY
ncbi:aspartic peptidase domain-containing protein [Paraphoma chrysanthemicola]|nr:aspartic peptidase domain-containing protein [Paraphoma chrysanthemicola]